MNLVDSSGWIEYFMDGPNAAFFGPVLADKSQLIVPTIVIDETYRHALRQRGTTIADEQYALMSTAQVVPLTPELATLAATLSHDLKLAMADAIIYATAREHSAVLKTSILKPSPACNTAPSPELRTPPPTCPYHLPHAPFL